MKQPKLSDVLLGIAANNWQLSSSQYVSSITLPMWLIKIFQYRGLPIQRSVAWGSIAGLSVAKFCGDCRCQFSVFFFSWLDVPVTAREKFNISLFHFLPSSHVTCQIGTKLLKERLKPPEWPISSLFYSQILGGGTWDNPHPSGWP